jgi:steroid 5-alpha reductase family enzyme
MDSLIDLPWTLLGAAWLVSAVLMLVLWLVQLKLRDAGLVDVGWAASLGGMAVFYGCMADGSPAQRWLAGGLGGLWGLRLATYLLFDRVIGQSEDGRYRALRQHWGRSAPWQFAWFFQAQAVLAALLSLPFLIAASNPDPRIAAVQWFALALFVAAKLGESLADRQLARFRRRPDAAGRTCRVGLWRYSRHPNYFFEWLLWCAYALIALPAPGGALALAAPVLMYLLITRVTGIPYTEAQALRSRGEDYRRYQRTTNAFFPWFPRLEGQGASEVRS